jgi:hypothetical protein
MTETQKQGWNYLPGREQIGNGYANEHNQWDDL